MMTGPGQRVVVAAAVLDLALIDSTSANYATITKASYTIWNETYSNQCG